jgi:glyoxylase-like metal-dependent hydrolase (beta-lactamase superfamily II)
VSAARNSIAALLALGFAGCLLAADNPAGDRDLHVIHVQGNVYALIGAGGNITIQKGPDGILLVNTGTAANADRALAEIKKLSDGPIRYIINTDASPDQVGGNEKIGLAGSTIAGGNAAGDIGSLGIGATIVAQLNVLNRMSAPTGKQSTYPEKAWPTDLYENREKKMFFNGEAIEIQHIPAAHSDADSIVFFRRSDVISTGDLFASNGYPVIDTATGGSIQGTLEALNRLVDITVPADKQEGGTYVIPGHGRICDQADVVEYRDMITIIRDRIQDMVKKGLTLDQVRVAQPTLDYDPVFGSKTGAWTTDRFIEAVYKSFKK